MTSLRTARPASIGEEKKQAILFADIRGFTALSEPMSPYDVVYFLNRYFHLTSKVIESYGGYVDNTWAIADGTVRATTTHGAAFAQLAPHDNAGTVEKRSRHFEELYGVSVRIASVSITAMSWSA